MWSGDKLSQRQSFSVNCQFTKRLWLLGNWYIDVQESKYVTLCYLLCTAYRRGIRQPIKILSAPRGEWKVVSPPVKYATDWFNCTKSRTQNSITLISQHISRSNMLTTENNEQCHARNELQFSHSVISATLHYWRLQTRSPLVSIV